MIEVVIFISALALASAREAVHICDCDQRNCGFAYTEACAPVRGKFYGKFKILRDNRVELTSYIDRNCTITIPGVRISTGGCNVCSTILNVLPHPDSRAYMKCYHDQTETRTHTVTPTRYHTYTPTPTPRYTPTPTCTSDDRAVSGRKYCGVDHHTPWYRLIWLRVLIIIIVVVIIIAALAVFVWWRARLMVGSKYIIPPSTIHRPANVPTIAPLAAPPIVLGTGGVPITSADAAPRYWDGSPQTPGASARAPPIRPDLQAARWGGLAASLPVSVVRNDPTRPSLTGWTGGQYKRLAPAFSGDLTSGPQDSALMRSASVDFSGSVASGGDGQSRQPVLTADASETALWTPSGGVSKPFPAAW